MKLCFRSFSKSDEKAPPLLPELQATAGARGDFMLGYVDDGTGLLKPGWVYLTAFSQGGGTV
jgi:hypothetical protein